MFSAVPPRYDVVNRVITLGLDRHWRRLAARECLAGGARVVLDLCCGTGEIATLAGPGVRIAAYDFSAPMLDLAARKAARLGREIVFARGAAATMPFPDGLFDSVGLSFGFRNLTWRNPLADQHLAEVLRVLRKGGRFVIVESSQPASPVVRRVFHGFLGAYVRPVGSLLSGQPDAYRYLSESVARFPPREEVAHRLEKAGFRVVQQRDFVLGAVCLHVATT